MSSIKSTIDNDGIAILTWDCPDSSVNKINEQSFADFKAAFKAAVENDKVKGIVITSAKSDFIAGADLAILQKLRDMAPKDVFAKVMEFHELFRFMETCKKPVVAAMVGSALGGGLELALACHYRVAANNPKLRIGLPEVTFGLFPGAGGTQRLPRLVKLQDALLLLTEGRQVSAEDALKYGIVHKVVEPNAVLDEAKAYIKNGGSCEQPWDVKGFRLPSGDIHSPKGFETFMGANGLLSKMTYGNYPAPAAILECVYHGLQLDVWEGCNFEARKFTKICRSDAARNMIRNNFFNMQAANKLKDRPKDVPPHQVKKLGVLGAGLMGSGIAYVSAKVGIEVVLIDSTQELADKGKAAAAKIVEGRVSKGKMEQKVGEELVNRIHATTDYSKLADCSLIVEAVFEDWKVKEEVNKKVDAVIAKDAVIASNTSTLPISKLAEAVRDQQNFIGIHFFSPVDKMQLVEIIRGKKTNDAAVARALDYVAQIKKTPIVVNDSRGFYTSRVFMTYCAEGIQMLMEGISPALIENAGRMAGMPMGPLEVADMVGLDTVQKIVAAAREDLGSEFDGEKMHQLVTKMVKEQQRLGKKNGKGFYDYLDKHQKQLWTGLKDNVDAKPIEADVESVKNRLLIIQALEALRCMEEHVVLHPADADVGSVLGWGFCPFHGGIASYVDTVGNKWLIEQTKQLEKTCGKRFAAPKLLLELDKENKSLYEHKWNAREKAGVV
ncbi:MAG TPA: 3-hydroxyacyl-CoA dehydrogenase NAD-binding domain-containing protein [Planktothrix sp.]|jgi:3-hydroxyacyl-CoA dehydrogenase/enoyl-CoA hydratase/3-hydroxybutyryl-CoA epimerase